MRERFDEKTAIAAVEIFQMAKYEPPAQDMGGLMRYSEIAKSQIKIACERKLQRERGGR